MTDSKEALTAYEVQVLIGTSISGCNMPPDRVFDLPAAWKRLNALGMIDRTDGLAIVTPAGEARIAAALSASSPPVGGSGEVVVKALDWGETSYGRPEASTVVGVYRIYESVSGGWSASRGGLHADVLKDKDGRKNFATLDAAKAAAQADYETRIRSALAAPVPNGVPEGAIVNGRTLIDRLEHHYQFACEGGSLAMCSEWQDLVRCFEHLADYAAASHVTPEGLSGGGRATHRHKKRGSEYVLIGFGRMQSGNWHQTERRHDTTIGSWLVVGQPADMREVAIYRSIDDGGLLWVRPRDEFEDGRFEAIV